MSAMAAETLRFVRATLVWATPDRARRDAAYGSSGAVASSAAWTGSCSEPPKP